MDDADLHPKDDYAWPMKSGSNGIRLSPCPQAPQPRLLNPDHQTILLLGPIVFITIAIGHGLTRQQIDSLNEPINIFLAPQASAPPSAPPSALQPCNPALSELLSQPIFTPLSACSYPPSSSVETIEEVEQKQVYKPLRKIQQTMNKYEASKKTSTSWLPSAEICFGWPTKYGRSSMGFSLDEDLVHGIPPCPTTRKSSRFEQTNRIVPMPCVSVLPYSLRFDIALF